MKLTALLSPERAADVVDAAARELLTSHFDVTWADPADPGSAHGADVVLTSWGTKPLPRSLWADGSGPKVVAHAAGSVKKLIDPVVLDQGVAVFSAAQRIAWSVGEYCLAAMLTLGRRLPRFDTAIRNGGWKQTGFRGHELAGQTVGIVGASSTARALIQLLQPFHPEIVVYDPYLSADRAHQLGVRLGDLTVVMRCRFVSIHVPDVPATKGMITRDLIGALPDGAVVVNSSRGPAIDQSALLDEVVAGRIHAALDVYDPEPPTLGPEVLAAPNLLLTPHIAGDTEEGHLALTGFVLADVLRWLDDGTRGPSFVDPSAWSIAA